MTQSGYDLRQRHTGRVPTVTPTNVVGVNVYGSLCSKAEAVVSYRDNVEGELLLDSDVDPYMDFLSVDKTIKYKEQRLVQRELERAGLPGLPDYEVKEFVDNGHPFDKTSYEVNTSLRTQREFVSSPYNPFICTGGPFYTAGAQVQSQHTDKMLFDMNSASSYTYNAFFPNDAFPMPPIPESELDDFGKRALSIVAPGRPKVDLFRGVGELLAGIPQLPGKALLSGNGISSGGDEWLNALFGIIPTYQDVVDVGGVLKNLSAALLQYRRDNGKVVRRSWNVPTVRRSSIITSDQLSLQGGIYAGNTDYGLNRTGNTGSYSSSQVRRDLQCKSELFMIEERTQRFSGAFTYYIPTTPAFAGNVGRYVTELDRVINLGPDASNMWELTPWSWLSDWFIDIGSQLDLASVAFDDNLVINYGYAMEHSKRSVVCKTELVSATPISGVTFASTYMTSERKRRIRANPYGFVDLTNTGDWNPFRWSILSALGISRLR